MSHNSVVHTCGSNYFADIISSRTLLRLTILITPLGPSQTNSDILIDPELLRNNPALNYITLINNASDPISQNGRDSNPTASGSVNNQLNTSSTCTHEQFGCLVKSHMNLSNHTEAALNNFCMNSSSIEKFLILLYTKVLQLEDMGRDAKKLEASQGLSHDLKSVLINIMVLWKINDSMAINSPTRNIAELTQAVLKKTTVPPMLQVYIHLAVLFWHFIQYPEWMKLLNYGNHLTFNNIYNEDKAKFGNPANTSHQATDPKHVPDWIIAVNNHASKVLGGQAKRKKGKGLKRKQGDD
ncbi:hypothetical protein L208DRAFT_1381219 [Tricholoma matsutake]|nr:hypothetical protein L208DRAFT_1381219 [Tricholoma matsutake 945]